MKASPGEERKGETMGKLLERIRRALGLEPAPAPRPKTAEELRDMVAGAVFEQEEPRQQ